MKASTLLILIVALILLLIGSLFLRDLYFNEPSNGEADSLLMYEWPQLQGDPSFTRFSEGPAPETNSILWKTNITGIQSYVVAFSGKVFVTTKTEVFALDRKTGDVIWRTVVPEPGSWPSVYKIDNTRLVIGSSCLDVESGSILWTSDTFSATASPFFVVNVYSPEERMFYVKNGSFVQGWDFSNPSTLPAKKWETYVSGGGLVGSGVQYGDGKVFPGSYDPHQVALDAKTGKILWDTETKTPMVFSGTYYEGKFFRGGTHDNSLYCFDADDGEILWTFNPGTEDGYFCVGPAVAYGMVYELNKDGHLYALDVNTGDLMWKYQGPGPIMFPGSPAIADGKIYATTGQTASYTGQQSESEFVCLDAYTGELIWQLPIEAYAPRESVAIAYGNLYLIPGDVTTAVDTESGEEYATFNQVWAIGTNSWPMWRHDSAHSAVGQSGPTNLTLRWKYSTAGAIVSSPAIAEGRIYFGSHDKNIYCLSARTGIFLWKFQTVDRMKSSPAVVDGRVYVGPDDGQIYCLDSDNGSLVWKTDAGGPIQVDFGAAPALRSSPIVVEEKVYVGSLDTNVYCLDAYHGSVSWTYRTGGFITSSPAVLDNAVYVVSQEPNSGVLYKLNAIDGSLMWKREIPYEGIHTGGTDLHASPTVADGLVFASSNVKEYYAINASTGNVEWTYRTSGVGEFIVCSPVYKDGNLFIVDHYSIVCVDAKNGQTIWSTYLGEELYVSPSYADGKVYVVTDQRSVYVLNAADGSKISFFKTGSNSWSSPTLGEGRLYVGNNDWNVYCLADSPAKASFLTIGLTENHSEVDKPVTVAGSLFPAHSNALISLYFTKPDDTVTSIQTTTSTGGTFNITYVPDVVGNWTLVAEWESDNSLYASTSSDRIVVEVAEAAEGQLALEYVYLLAFMVVVVGVAFFGYVFFRRVRKR